jgi:hypothetical protein
MLDLKALAEAHGFRVSLDESAEIDTGHAEKVWLWRIPAHHGFISVHGPDTLAAWSGNPRVVPRLIALPFVRIKQWGDRECRVLFDPGHLSEVAELLGAKKRRQLSESHRAKLVQAGRRTRF